MDTQVLSQEQITWLEENKLPRDRWLYSSNAKPFIDEMCASGIMQPAHGEFSAPRQTGESLSLLGKTFPVMDMVSLYMLTPAGRNLVSDLATPAPPMNSGREDGGAAFPVTAENGLGHVSSGLSVRDYFAGQALANVADRFNDRAFDPENAAKIAYEFADAMIAERSK